MFVSDLLHKKRQDVDELEVKVEVIESSITGEESSSSAMVPTASKPSDAFIQHQEQTLVVTTVLTTSTTSPGAPTATGEPDGLTKKPRPVTKSKKKKNAPAGENTGRWTAEEHRLFLQGLEQHGKGWKKIAGLIKSRTVVQIRTHAQKYFQKLAKARQNGEDGDVTLEPMGAAMAAAPLVAPKRRRLTGTKRKPIQSVVASAQRQGKKLAAAQAASGVPNPMAPLPAISPVLAHFVVSSSTKTTDEIPAPGTVTGQELEDSIFRFLTPCPPVDAKVNDIARQAGADPINAPQGTNSSSGGGDVSPTGVNEMISIYPSWTDTKETPSWYAKGDDIHALLDLADNVDWLTDTGGDDEGYEPPPVESISLSTLKESPSGSSILDENLQMFDTPIDEQAFVSTILSSDINLQASDE